MIDPRSKGKSVLSLILKKRENIKRKQVSLLCLWWRDLETKMVKLHANGRNSVGQQLLTLLDVKE